MAYVLREVYNFLWYLALPFGVLAAHPWSARDFRERFGRGKFPDTAGAPRIWMHAASVGEIEAIRPVALGLLKAYPGAVLAITTMTTAGRGAAERRIPGAAAYMLAPLDIWFAVRTLVARVQPELVLIAEGEIWPNFFFEARRFGAKVAIINGRMSERSRRRYMMARSLFKQVLSQASVIMAQSREDARRYGKFDISSKMVVTGNTKIAERPAMIDEPLRSELQEFAVERQILIAGSTAPGEEAVVVGAYLELLKRFPALALALAPRHLDRVDEIEKVLRANSLDYVKASELGPERSAGDSRVLLLDTMGDLRAFYRRGAIAFIGGSLAPGRGGQNPAEPAMLNVPVLIGPYHENQNEMVSALLNSGGARIVKNARDLVAACDRWLGNETERVNAGQQAHNATARYSGSARLALKQVQGLLSLN
jgi:3-deoxy-D-manno-octulosonic-acid transferase